MKMITNSIGVTNTQLARIHILLQKINRMAYKADYVIDITDGREISTTKLTHDEANRMIAVLAQEEREQYRNRITPADKMRKKIISCCRECGMNIGNKANMSAVEAWVLKYGYLHKPLNKYTEKELPQLVTQAKNMKTSFLKGVRR